LKDLIQLITPYKFFNNLIPGGIIVEFIIFIFPDTLYNFGILEKLLFYYFFGVIIAKTGSVIMQELLQKSSLIEKYSYEDFIKSTQKDDKIQLLSDEATQYRSFLTVSLIIFIILVIHIINISCFTNIGELYLSGFCFYCVILFYFSLKNQTSMICKRILMANKKK
jgi:hypothetical protein